MSGVSLAVDTHSDLNPSAPKQTPQNHQRPPQTAPSRGIMGSLRVIELQLVAFIMVFSASGLVPLLDLAFPAFVSVYLLALARLAFPSRGRSSNSQEIFHGGRFFRIYMVVGTTVGLFLPLAYVLGGFARGDDHAVKAATPHLFLLSFQILTENLISGLSLFSPPVRALVPLLYTVRRIFVILDWIYVVWVDKTIPANAELKDVVWVWFGKVLAVVNLAYFSINLFGFLIPRFLPRAFDVYFKERDEISAKTAEDRRSTLAAQTHPDNQQSDKKAD